MMRVVMTHAIAVQRVRRAALVTECVIKDVLAKRSVVLFSTSGVPCNKAAREVALPSYITFRMPDLDFKEVGSGAADATLTKWCVQEGVAVKDGTHMCEIDTPDLSFQLESGDEGYIARLLVGEGVNNISPGQPLAIIVPTEAEVEQFVKVLKENPHCIEGYVGPACMTRAVADEVAATPTENAASSDVLRKLNKLHKEGFFEDEQALKILKSLARKNDEQLLTTYKASYEGGVLEEGAFDKVFFVENALELAEEASGTSTERNAS